MVRGRELRARREALGKTVSEVATALRIPARYLEALEDERYSDLPSGPYTNAYTRAVAVHLGIEPPPDPDPGDSLDARPAPQAPLWLVRLTAGSTLVVLGAMLVWFTVALLLPMDRQGPTTPSMQEVTLGAHRKALVRVTVDGVPEKREELFVGQEPWRLRGRVIEVDAPVLSAVEIHWNGELVRPQGRQGGARRLRFVDDRE